MTLQTILLLTQFLGTVLLFIALFIYWKTYRRLLADVGALDVYYKTRHMRIEERLDEIETTKEIDGGAQGPGKKWRSELEYQPKGIPND